MIRVAHGAVAPERLRLTVRNRANGAALDFSTVTAAALHIDGSAREPWPCVIESASSSHIVISHDFAEGDVPRPALLRLVPVLETPGGPRRGRLVHLEVT